MKKMDKSKAKALFNAAKEKAAEGGGFSRPNPGRYVAHLKTCAMHESQKGKLFVKHQWVILEGEFEGKSYTDFRGVESEVGLSMLMQEWAKLGVDCEGIDDFDALEAVAKEIEEASIVAKIRIAQNKNNAEFDNYYIEDVVDQGYGLEPVEEEKPKAEKAKAEKPKAEKKAKKAPEPEPEPEEEDEGEDEGEDLVVGSWVEFKQGKKTLKGEVTEIDEENEEVTISVDGKNYTVSADAIESIVDPE